MSQSSEFLRRTSACIRRHRQRAQEAGQFIDYGLEQLRELVKGAMSSGCFYCREPITESNWGADHETPTSRGGSYCLWNVKIVCRACNEAKHILTADEFSALWEPRREMSEDSRKSILRRLRAGAKVISRRG